VYTGRMFELQMICSLLYISPYSEDNPIVSCLLHALVIVKNAGTMACRSSNTGRYYLGKSRQCYMSRTMQMLAHMQMQKHLRTQGMEEPLLGLLALPPPAAQELPKLLALLALVSQGLLGSQALLGSHS